MRRAGWILAMIGLTATGIGAAPAEPANATNPSPPAAAEAAAVASTGTAAVVSAPLEREWVGTVRVLRGEAGDVRAVRLITGDKLMAVELNETGVAMAGSPRDRRLAIRGELEVRDGRSWLVASEFRDAPAAPAPAAAEAPPPVPMPEPAAPTSPPPAEATAPTNEVKSAP